VRDDHDDIIGVLRKKNSKRVRSARRNILQRFSSRKPHLMRRLEPGIEGSAICPAYIIMRFELPIAIVNIVELRQHSGRESTCIGNCLCGLDTASHRTAKDRVDMPSGRDATRKQLRFHSTPLRQRELLPAAKSRWVDAVNMSVACKKEFQFVFTILG
jgi:hypothetical protein